MGKTIAEYVKLIITSILSVFMTLVVMSGTVIKNKADKSYVDAQDNEIKTEFRKSDTDLKNDFIEQLKEIKDMQKEVRSDIKELLKK